VSNLLDFDFVNGLHQPLFEFVNCRFQSFNVFDDPLFVADVDEVCDVPADRFPTHADGETDLQSQAGYQSGSLLVAEIDVPFRFPLAVEPYPVDRRRSVAVLRLFASSAWTACRLGFWARPCRRRRGRYQGCRGLEFRRVHSRRLAGSRFHLGRHFRGESQAHS
jgi:hypothetical protein